MSLIRARIEKSIARARKYQVHKAHASNVTSQKAAKVLENRTIHSLEENKKAQELLDNLNNTLKHSRVICI